MVSEEIKKSIKEAKTALDSIDTLGETSYDICDGILLNIKAFIHDPEIKKLIDEHETKTFQEFRNRYDKAAKELQNKGPMANWREAADRYIKLRHWKSLEMLSFYDKLSKEHDI
jgi:hypothetical protein